MRAAPLEDVRTVHTVGAPAVAAPEFVDGLLMIRSRPIGLADHRLVVPVREADLRGALGQQASPSTRPGTGSILTQAVSDFARARSLTKSQIRALIQRLNALALYNGAMTDLKRATVYFDPNLHKALRMKAAETDHSLSDLVNTAVRCSLAEDTEDLATFDLRAKEPNLAFENVLKDLTRRGKL